MGTNGRVLQTRRPVGTTTRRRTTGRRVETRSSAGPITQWRGRTAATPGPPRAAQTGRGATSPISATSSCRMAATATALTAEKIISLSSRVSPPISSSSSFPYPILALIFAHILYMPLDCILNFWRVHTDIYIFARFIIG